MADVRLWLALRSPLVRPDTGAGIPPCMTASVWASRWRGTLAANLDSGPGEDPC